MTCQGFLELSLLYNEADAGDSYLFTNVSCLGSWVVKFTVCSTGRRTSIIFKKYLKTSTNFQSRFEIHFVFLFNFLFFFLNPLVDVKQFTC